MSWAHVQWAIRERAPRVYGLSATEALVLFAVCAHADPDGDATVAARTLAAEINLSLRTVQLKLARLIELELISIECDPRGALSTGYRVPRRMPVPLRKSTLQAPTRRAVLPPDSSDWVAVDSVPDGGDGAPPDTPPPNVLPDAPVLLDLAPPDPTGHGSGRDPGDGDAALPEDALRASGTVEFVTTSGVVTNGPDCDSERESQSETGRQAEPPIVATSGVVTSATDEVTTGDSVKSGPRARSVVASERAHGDPLLGGARNADSGVSASPDDDPAEPGMAGDRFAEIRARIAANSPPGSDLADRVDLALVARLIAQLESGER
ncbi:helix-turn-helix domain-containing protein [Microbacterium sp. NPDC058389]|uniref:helix-turn-helix domain-containing protein n=1 Tax=Microbacterium sp. NPDC058389 TaxID=3346475 RepID=UPI00365B2F02